MRHHLHRQYSRLATILELVMPQEILSPTALHLLQAIARLVRTPAMGHLMAPLFTLDSELRG